jgi:hypothetical protein
MKVTGNTPNRVNKNPYMLEMRLLSPSQPSQRVPAKASNASKRRV